MKRCKKCVIINIRPGISFDDAGICFPCKNYENKKNMNQKQRWSELEELCNKHRKDDGSYDCIITVSGGKDSTYQVGLFKENLKMNPLFLMV